MTQRCRAKFPLIFSVFVGMYLFISAAAAHQLPACQRVTQIISLKKDGCSGAHLVETSICTGYCKTKEPLLINDPSDLFINPLNEERQKYQKVCMYKEFYNQKAKIPGCPNGVDPYVTFPVARTCNCTVCSMENCDPMWSHPTELCTDQQPFYYY